MAKQKLTDTEQVDLFFEKLDHPLKSALQLVRETILACDPEVTEQIKWNSPSFYYTGDMAPFDPKEYKRDIVVSNLHKNDVILLIFPTGNIISDPSGLLGGAFKDTRKSISFRSEAEVKQNQGNLQNIIKDWLTKIEK